MLTPEQVEHVKKGLKEHIDSSFPDDRKEFAKTQVDAMSPEDLEQFLIKNNLIQGNVNETETCIFCSIVSGKIPSHSISANEMALAVLEINPMSKGHTLIIPKEHIKEKKLMPPEAKKLASQVSKLLKKKLLADSIKTESSNLFGHEIISLIPIYEDSPKQMQRAKETEEQLRALEDLLTERAEMENPKDKKKAPIKKLVEKIEEKFWLPRRIP